MRKQALAIIVGLFLFAGGAVTAHAATYYVDDNTCPSTGSGTQASPYCSIQTALSAAQPGDIVSVAAGIYKQKIEMPRAGTSTALTGTVTCTKDSTSVTGSGTSFSSQVRVGDFVRCRTAGAGSAGNGFRWAEVASVSSNTALTLKTAYIGLTATGTADVARFIQLIGDSANPDNVVIDAYDEKPAGLVLKKLSGYQNIWYYDTTDANATGAWKNPQGFHEKRNDTDYYTFAGENGADPYLFGQDNMCPWGSTASKLQGMDTVPGSYAITGTTIYVHIRSNGDPNTINLRASRNPEYSAMLSASQQYTIVDGFSAWGGFKHTQRNKAMNRAMHLGATNSLYKNLKGYNGQIYILTSNGLDDVTFKNVRGFMGVVPPTSAPGSRGFSGLLMEDIEARGGISNVSSNDGIWGVSADDRVIFRGWHVHDGTAGKEGVDCGAGPNWYEYRTDTFLDGGYEGPHGLYIGSQTQGQPTGHFILENSIFERNYDGAGIYSSNSSDMIVRNNIFGPGGNNTERLMFGSSGNTTRVVVRNNIFYRENYKNRDDWNNNGAIWTYNSNSYLDSDYNLFLHPTLSGPHIVNKIPNQASYTLDQARSQGKEAHSIEVSSGSHHFIDASYLDGTPTNLRLLGTSPAINTGDNAQCPTRDKDGNLRSDGRCDIGPYEYNGGGGTPDTQAPTAPTNLSASPVSSSQINLSWTASTDNVAVTGYKVLRSTTNGGPYTQVGTTAGTTYSDTGLTANTTYYYVVQAYDAANNTSGNSNQASATTQGQPSDTQPPTVPTNLTATAVSSSQINLSWTASTDNVAVTGYNIKRSTTNGGPYTQIGTSTTTSYQDTSLAANTTYYYIVQAYDAAGNTSGSSQQASATTQGSGGGGSNAVTTTNDFFTDEATLHNLAFRWVVTGDDNKNAVASVQYQAAGESTWRDAISLHRINSEVCGLDNELTCGNLFAGSVLNLNPGTTYNVKITVSDPDGVNGTSQRTVTATTRTEPQATTNGTTRHVYPSCSGPVSTPCYTDIVAAAQAAQPGDLVLIHEGTYNKSSVDLSFLSGRATSESQPIVFRGVSRDAVIYDGGVASGGRGTLFNLAGTKYIYLEQFTIRNAGTAISAPNAQNLVVRKMKIDQVWVGIYSSTSYAGTDRGWYIADNEVIGWNTPWYPSGGSNDKSAYGIMVYGKGHIVEYNKVGKFHDCIAHPDSSDLKASNTSVDWKNPPVRSIDFNNNDIYECADDGIVMDYSYQNFRVWNNRITNAHSGISTQPVYCGPAYIYRNDIYNIPAGNSFKLHNKPVGVYIYNNSSSDATQALQVDTGWENARILNNLTMGKPNHTSPMWATGDERHTLTKIDYNGITPVSSSASLISWNGTSYKDNAAFYAGTGYQQHGFTTNYSDFVSCQAPTGEGTTYTPGQCNYQLTSSAVAINKGTVIPTITDGYAGSAPDAGSHEYGSTMPVYGIRIGSSSDTQAPTIPTNLSASPVSSSQINLSWTASTDNVAVTGYKVLRSTTNGGPYTQVGTTAATTYSDTGLVANTTYYYVVQAYDAAGNTSGNSNQASATTQGQSSDTQPPTVPTNLTATAVSSSQINLSWTASTDNVGVTGYNIKRSTTNGGPYTQIGISATTSYQDTGLAANTTYYYIVQAYDAANNTSGNSNQASAKTQSTGGGNETSFTVRLVTVPKKGAAPLKNVDLAAYVFDKAVGATYTYSYYCNRKDPGLDVTPDFIKQVTVTAKSNVALDVCNYGTEGVYLAKVIVTKGSKAAEWRSSVTATGPTVKGYMLRDLKRGMRGDDVKDFQKALIELGYLSARPGATGYYGVLTDRAVRAFKKAQKLPATSGAADVSVQQLVEQLAE